MVERRLFVIGGVLGVWSAAVVKKLTSLQVVHHEEYLKKARAKQEVVRTLPAPRGTIFDRQGQTLAMSLPSQAVIVNPTKLPDIGVATDLLEQILHTGDTKLYEKLKQAADSKRGYFVVKAEATAVEAANLRALPVDWIDIESRSQRHYPKGSLAAHILGGVDFAEKGNAGLEKSLEEPLHGEPGREYLLTDVKRRGIESHDTSEAKPGTQITLTIDERIQFVAEQALKIPIDDKKALTGSIVVMDPNTGDILAMASYPTFDANDAPTGKEDTTRQNHAASVPFEPGSVFKVITLSAALETTHLRPETIIDCGNGILNIQGGKPIHEAHGGWPALTMEDVLKHSSNVGAAHVGMIVGKANMLEYIKRFGFAQHTGIGLPGESRGMLDTSRWSAPTLPHLSIGSEISVTTLQIARAISVIANGGLMVKPRLVLKRGTQMAPVEPPTRVIKPETAFTMRQMMQRVVEPLGTGYPEAKLAGYSCAGKTGSAQIYDPKLKMYTHHYNATFAGMAPLTNPRVVVISTLNYTYGEGGYGGRIAAPLFNQVAMEALRILEIPRDLPDEPAKNAVAQNGEPATSPAAPQPAQTTQAPQVSGRTGGAVAAGGLTVPNFQGMTMRDVLATAESRGLTVLPAGSGTAKTQDPPPGSVLRQGERIRVQFTR